MDERMHTTPWFWTTHEGTATSHRDHSHMPHVGLPNCHPKNLVQAGIGGWYGNRPGSAVAKARGTSVMTMRDVELHGPGKAAEIALEMAWEGCKAVYLSFDIDSIDPAFAAGYRHARTRRPPAARSVRDDPYHRERGDSAAWKSWKSRRPTTSDNTAQLACRVILDVVGTLIASNRIGHRGKVMK